MTPMRRRFLLALTASTLLAGCAVPHTASGPTAFEAPRLSDEGVVIAESTLVTGVSKGNSITGGTDDCVGPGLGVTVGTTRGDDRFLFDKNGEPCDSAEMLFDGRSQVNQRQGDPAITLKFFDGKSAKTTGDLPDLQPVPTIQLKSELLPQGGKAVAQTDFSAIEPAAGPAKLSANGTVPATPAPVQVAAVNKPDPVLATLASWQNQDTVYAARSEEATAAAERNLNNIVKGNRSNSEQETMSKLMAQLRERERQVQEEQRRHTETLERAQRNRDITVAARNEWQQKESELEGQLKATQQRLAQVEQLAQRLNAEKANKEKAYQQQINTLSSDLKVAEQQADVSRRELILQAAAKIAEAEQLASAAKIQEQQIKLREAARLKSEAETMMDRALAMNSGKNVLVNGVGAPPAVPLQLMETPVTVVANGKTLPEILSDVLKQAAPQAGAWKADWQLAAANKKLLSDKWSLTAEAPVEQVLAQLNQQVKDAYGFPLLFTQFGQSQLIVVTEATPPTR
ncbi:MAG: hypothetical protein DI628_08610 [Blastochloris viridis]|uniref:Toxin co-regulated pilus biosynthesis protein Q C-terminal domain-containing protein n=1 Tax=Blastochloris viridis TaxID=1079 RepID=A0A6N4R0P2_BLAVI|nr:MAG: hypothetical protein DI628_08610 [Blastochloris viridis]